MIEYLYMFLTHHNLQGSQTGGAGYKKRLLFLTHHNLQGSQTNPQMMNPTQVFLTHHNLQGSQTKLKSGGTSVGFLPIIIYKVLKLNAPLVSEIFCFLPIIIYKVLKRVWGW